MGAYSSDHYGESMCYNYLRFRPFFINVIRLE